MAIGENNKNISYTENINLQDTESYHLSMEISQQTVLFSLLEIKNLKYDYFKLLRCDSKDVSDLIALINTEDLLKQNYSSSTISYSHYPSTIIPNKVYENKHKRRYLEFTDENIQIIKSENIHQIDSTIIYSIPKKLNNIINQIQPQIIDRNNSNILITQLIKQYNNLTKKNVFLFVKESKIEIIVLQKEKLFFQNTFSWISENDVLYFVLFLYEQLELEPEEAELYIFGKVDQGDKIYSLLYDYIRNIKFGEISKNLSFSKELSSINDHQHFGLFSQLLCV